MVLGIFGLVAPAPVGAQQLTVTRSVTVNQTISDRGQYVSAIDIANSGLASIDSVSASLNLASADNSRPMVLGQYAATLTRGTASGGATSVELFNRPNSTASSLNGNYTFATQFDGSWTSDRWSMLVADTIKGGGSAIFQNWGVSITGTAASGGTVALGSNGEVAVSSGTTSVGTTYTAGSGEQVGLKVSGGATMDFSSGGGGLSGSGSFNATGGGKVVLGGSNSGFTGTLGVKDAGTVEVNSNGALGSGTVALDSGSTLKLGNGVSLSQAVSVAAGTTAKLETASSTTAAVTAAALNGVDGTLEKRGTGVAVISGTTSGFDGVLAVKEGGVKVDAGANLGAASTVNVARESFNPVTDARVTISGTGTVGNLAVGAGGAVGPGNSPGQLNAGNTTWGAGGAYQWEINDFLGTGGTNWDFLNITGTLSIGATNTNPFLIDVISLLATNSAGDAQNFDPLSSYSFAIATASGGITGFDVAKFTLSTANFSNNFYDGVWSISTSAGGGPQSLLLNYSAATAIPEPNSASLVLLGLGIAYWKRRRNSA